MLRQVDLLEPSVIDVVKRVTLPARALIAALEVTITTVTITAAGEEVIKSLGTSIAKVF